MYKIVFKDKFMSIFYDKNVYEIKMKIFLCVYVFCGCMLCVFFFFVVY